MGNIKTYQFLVKGLVLLTLGSNAAFFSLPFFLLLPHKSEAATEACRYVKSDESTVVATVCESSKEIEFLVNQERLVIDADFFWLTLETSLAAWFKDNLLTYSPSVSTSIWLTVPDSNPLNYQARLLYKDGPLNLSFSFDPHGVRESSTFKFDQVSVLGTSPYPDSFGWRPKTLLAIPTESFKPDLCDEFLRQHGVEVSRDQFGGNNVETTDFISVNTIKLQTTILKEETSERTLKTDRRFKSCFSSLNRNHVFEWNAFRGLVLKH